ncbi:DUF4148 domain-containing protein [Bordetella tumulicola]|uniref:DUF4148 domain-containing protein n=1 Tax=Bordetella tumulicola TaxID=1649133 RepID=UPI0039EE105C
MTTRTNISRLLACAILGTGFVSATQAQEETPAQTAHSTSTRAEVVADLQAWKATGMDDVWHGENTPDIDSLTYRELHERYVQASGNDTSKLAQRTNGSMLR